MEYGRERKKSREGWVEERCIGSGGFGTVTLYENKITKQQIALKRCRMDLNAQNKKLWRQEVDIMKRLDHPNLVSAKDVPAPLDVSVDELPLLAMEFCSGGDLRKVLNSPESCCGLKEKTVLKIASDVAAAVEFLHGHRIIHRDLKPENIVISHVDNKVVYKLIDLGYAKELDQGSLATTFVGTLKYLAPELLDKVQYTKTVDYWSFGTVLFECITGMRPFLTELSPVQWYNKVRSKGPDDICAYFDLKEEIQFSSVLPTPNSLCRQLQDKFVALLRLLLLWDPQARGGSVLESGKRECFDVLEKIFNTVIVRVFLVSSAVAIPFEVLPSETIEDLQVKLSEATGVDVKEQELLLASGQAVKPNTLVMDCIKDDQIGDDCALFLLPTSVEPKSTRPLYTLPPTVQGMVTEQKTLMSYEELKRAFAQGVNFCREQTKINQLLIEGFRAAQISLLVLNSKLGQLKSELLTESNKLEAKIDFFNSSLQTDLEIYADNINLVKNDKLLRNWKRAQKKVESFQNNDVTQLKEFTAAVQTKVVELQKSPYTSGTQSKSKPDGMRYDCAVKLYEKLKQSDRRPADSQPMATIILQILAQREKLHRDICTQLSEVMSCRREIRKLMYRVIQVKEKLITRANELTEDKNSNHILSSTYPHTRDSHEQFEGFKDDENLYEEIISTSTGDSLFRVKRNSEVLGSLTRDRAPPPKNRRRPSLKKRQETSQIFTNSEEELDKDFKQRQSKAFVHPLVDEAKSKDVVSTTPPRSPRSARSSRIQSPSASTKQDHGEIDEVDSSPLRSRKDLITQQYKKKHHGAPIVPPLELYKLQQHDAADEIQLSPRERYERFGTDEALLSPRSRPLTIDTRTTGYECPPSPPHEQIEHSWFERRVESSPKGEQTVKQLTKTISQLKKKIRDFEDAFEDEHARRPSQSEKAPIKKYVSELGRARKQLKELKERAKCEAERLNETVPPMSGQGMKSSSNEPLLTTTPASIEHSLESLLNKLEEKREEAGRPEEVEQMGREQLQDEKLAVQKALLQHESLFGRPNTKKDKDLMRPLYDRYRTIKRKLAAPVTESPVKIAGGTRPRTSSIDRLVSDLAPIHEDAPLHSPSRSGGSPARSLTQSLPITGRDSPRRRSAGNMSYTDTLDADDEAFGDTIQDTLNLSDSAQLREDAKFHEMSRDELSDQLELKRKEKKKMRKKLKKFEDDFLEHTGRRVQREDRGEMESDYHEYKHIKHQLKLIEALLTKRQVTNTM